MENALSHLDSLQIYTDAEMSPASMQHSVWEGILEFYREAALCSPLLQAGIEQREGHLLAAMGVDYAPCNGLVEQGPNLSEVQLNAAIQFFTARQLPFLYWTRRVDLEHSGFQPGGVMRGIGLDLAQWAPLTLPAHRAQIHVVQSSEQMVAFMRILADAFAINPQAEQQLGRLLDVWAAQGKATHLLAICDGIPVATATITTGSSVAGLWNGATVEAFRRQGIMTLLLQHALQIAQQRGQTRAMALLMPKGMARGATQRLGFVDVMDFPFYIYGTSDPLE
jgi:GNAT superfamily N-acetyltransferase